MTASTENRLTPARRLGQGLARTASGPVDVARGSVGLGAQAVAAAVSGLRRRYQDGQLRRELEAAQEAVARDLAAAGEVLADLPDAFREARANRHASRRPWVIAGAVGATLVLGGAAFAVVRRRASRPEPSTLPPSVQVDPKP
ncbi:cell wall synthesis protein CwsA [Mycobacterium sp. ACS4331]|uniref:cell wall synthesis protein CwsA n=1 Tax=Mycobacterium sp. ACS4331 TaxID=1834121 RepID=UPI0007FF854F|nr:cell wall synthesis protein CwsA [Mycobacterium sp. ACS4331]OBF23122.1 cell wall synthesis protein CwsA [Mycobacterium sp. ACS4331]